MKSINLCNLIWNHFGNILIDSKLCWPNVPIMVYKHVCARLYMKDLTNKLGPW